MKDIEGFEGLYAATRDGQIWSYPKSIQGGHTGKFLRPATNHKGYLFVNLRKNNRPKKMFVHRGVALAYIPNVYNAPQINHKNGIKTDNRVENLEWCTNQENRDHAGKTGLLARKLTARKVVEIRKLYIEGSHSRVDLVKKFGVSYVMVSNIVRNKSWKYV